MVAFLLIAIVIPWFFVSRGVEFWGIWFAFSDCKNVENSGANGSSVRVMQGGCLFFSKKCPITLITCVVWNQGEHGHELHRGGGQGSGSDERRSVGYVFWNVFVEFVIFWWKYCVLLETGPTGPQMQELSQYTYSAEHYHEVMSMLWKRMLVENKTSWRRVYKVHHHGSLWRSDRNTFWEEFVIRERMSSIVCHNFVCVIALKTVRLCYVNIST